MSAHTPGPWGISPNNPLSVTENSSLGARIITRVYAGNSRQAHRQAISDALLMAAAPDLLAALKKIMPWHEDPHEEEHNRTHPLIAECRAAIAKAEGRSI